MQPTDSEPICLVSYEITCILLGGGPDSRPGFWNAYRRELELNEKTEYRNYHVKLCAPHLSKPIDAPMFYRGNRLVTEREIKAGSGPDLP